MKIKIALMTLFVVFIIGCAQPVVDTPDTTTVPDDTTPVTETPETPPTPSETDLLTTAVDNTLVDLEDAEADAELDDLDNVLDQI